ncbi:MAG: succinylglutamate desuccinylase/aspartoacylase family protein [Bacteroidota bacterium]
MLLDPAAEVSGIPDFSAYSDRIIGEIKGSEQGPIVIALTGMHGNEPSGIEALSYIFNKFSKLDHQFNGYLIGLKANLAALDQKCRFIDEDMNRIWFTSIIDKIKRAPEDYLTSSERRETKVILNIIEPLMTLAQETGRLLIFADLHTFSAEEGMFTVSVRDEKNIDLLSQLHVPLIFGIERALHGTALKYMQNMGAIAFALESGKHFSKAAEDNAKAGLILLLTAAGCIHASDIPDFARYYDYMLEQNAQLPHKVEFVYRHIIEKDEEFVMRPGFKNFDKVSKGDWLANDCCGKIHAQNDGYILMPLYQEQGNEGFFIVKPID